MIDLIGTFALVLALFTSGPPDQVVWSFGAGVNFGFGSNGEAASITIGLDITPVRYRPAPSTWYPWGPNYCGMSDGYNVWVAPKLNCVDTFKHEMIHVRQRQALGPIGFMLLPDKEAHPSNTAKNMLHPFGLNYPLIRLDIPLRWER